MTCKILRLKSTNSFIYWIDYSELKSVFWQYSCGVSSCYTANDWECYSFDTDLHIYLHHIRFTLHVCSFIHVMYGVIKSGLETPQLATVRKKISLQAVVWLAGRVTFSLFTLCCCHKTWCYRPWAHGIWWQCINVSCICSNRLIRHQNCHMFRGIYMCLWVFRGIYQLCE